MDGQNRCVENPESPHSPPGVRLRSAFALVKVSATAWAFASGSGEPSASSMNAKWLPATTCIPNRWFAGVPTLKGKGHF